MINLYFLIFVTETSRRVKIKGQKEKNFPFNWVRNFFFIAQVETKVLFSPDNALINLRLNENIRSLLVLNKGFLKIVEDLDLHRDESSKDFVVKNYLYWFCSYVPQKFFSTA